MENKKVKLLLIEIIVNIFFFSICTLICVEVFVQAHNITLETSKKINASLQIESIKNYLETNDIEDYADFVDEKIIGNSLKYQSNDLDIEIIFNDNLYEINIYDENTLIKKEELFIYKGIEVSHE